VIMSNAAQEESQMTDGDTATDATLTRSIIKAGVTKDGSMSELSFSHGSRMSSCAWSAMHFDCLLFVFLSPSLFCLLPFSFRTPFLIDASIMISLDECGWWC